MQVFHPPIHRKYYIGSLVILILTAIFSIGHHNPDEHYQILEFSNYKMGFSPASDLPWEFEEKIRPALQPFIVYSLSQALLAADLYHPFLVTLLLRLFMALFTWRLACRLIRQLLPEFKTEDGRKLFILSQLFLWFVIYVGVRFSADNFSGLLFFLAMSFLLDVKNKKTDTPYLVVFIAGLLIGISWFARIQLAGAILGLGLWILFTQKWRIPSWVMLITGSITGIIFCIVIDYWFYGEWLLTPVNYFKVNVLQNRSADFGVSPVWYYLKLFFEGAVPPLSIVLLVALIAGIKQKPLHLFSFVLIPFLVEHFLIGHKEIRFLFPMIFALVFLAAIGIDGHIKYFQSRRIFRWIFVASVVVNFFVLLFRMFIPAAPPVKYYQHIYREYKNDPNTILVAIDESPYGKKTERQMNFYKPRTLDLRIIQNAGELKKIVDDNKGKSILFQSFSPQLPEELSSFPMHRQFCLFPEWLLKFNYNNWQERTHIWALYKIQN